MYTNIVTNGRVAWLIRRGFWLEPGLIRYDYSRDGLQSHCTVSVTALTNNALAGHLRLPMGPTRPTVLPGPTRLLGWLGWLGSWTPTELETRTALSICSPLRSISNWSDPLSFELLSISSALSVALLCSALLCCPQLLFWVEWSWV
jgi:hypothetical protein